MADPIAPSAVSLLDLHRALVGGDCPAVEQIWITLSRRLSLRLRRSFPRAPEDVIVDAVNDAIVAYAKRPHAFDPARHVPLDVWLSGIAAHKLLDRFRADRRASAREGEYQVYRRQAYGDQVNDRAIDRVAAHELRRKLPSVCDPTECAAMVAWLDGHDTGVVAARLGLSHLPRTEQRREKTRLIDRVIKRLKRALSVERVGPNPSSQKAAGRRRNQLPGGEYRREEAVSETAALRVAAPGGLDGPRHEENRISRVAVCVERRVGWSDNGESVNHPRGRR